MTIGPLTSPIALGSKVRFDGYLSWIDSANIKRVARLYIGKQATSLRKDECAAAIRTALQNEELLRGLYPGLSPFERFALSLLNAVGGSMPATELAGALWASGHPFRYGYGGIPPFGAPLDTLAVRGLVFVARPAGDEYHSWTYRDGLSGGLGNAVAFSDERLLRFALPCAPSPLEAEAVDAPARAIVRRPAEVALTLGKVAESIGRAKGLPLTVSGRVTKPGLARVERDLKTLETAPSEPALALTEPIAFLVGLFQASGILSLRPEARLAAMTDDAWQRLQDPYPDQARWWARGYQSLTGWAEFLPKALYDQDELHRRGKLNALRAALMTALGALPDPAAWYRHSDVADALRKRLQGRLSLAYLQTISSWQIGDAARREQQQQSDLAAWNASELPWLEYAVRGPLYHLGLVELGRADGDGSDLRVRLSLLGRAALWDPHREASGVRRQTVPSEPSGAVVPDVSAPCWIVQANLDVVVYLDRVTPNRLGFIARVAESQSAADNAAIYRLTRDSVYRALESGMDFATLHEGLSGGSIKPLSDSIRRTLEDWAARRERIRIHRQAAVLEFPNGTERQAAVEELGLCGAPLGERFFRLDEATLPAELQARLRVRNDYRLQPRRCLTVKEDGTVIAMEPPDLSGRKELGLWAEPSAARPYEWRLTEASVRRAAVAGAGVSELVTVLKGRALAGGVPPLLEIALQAWAAGHPRPGATLSTETVLLLEGTTLIEAVRHSALLRPYLSRSLGPGCYLIAPEHREQVQALLGSFGIAPAGTIPTPPIKTLPLPILELDVEPDLEPDEDIDIATEGELDGSDTFAPVYRPRRRRFWKGRPIPPSK